VDCLSLHLVFDSQTKVLQLYRFPSLCLLMCYSDTSCLSRFFSDCHTSEGFSDPEQNYARSYYREVMLSYRLIFGESNDSHKLYNSTKDDVTFSQELDHDPILDIVCGQNCRDEGSSKIWETINAGVPLNRYSTENFAFLGSRLLLIQNAIKVHEPDGFWPMWYDRRDTHRWWGFWPLFIISGAVLFLGILQAALQFLQLYFTIWPLKAL